jgi:hypothetical protein
MSRLGKPVNDYPDGVKLVGRERQTHNKIHADVFPFQAGIFRGCSNPVGLI